MPAELTVCRRRKKESLSGMAAYSTTHIPEKDAPIVETVSPLASEKEDVVSDLSQTAFRKFEARFKELLNENKHSRIANFKSQMRLEPSNRSGRPSRQLHQSLLGNLTIIQPLHRNGSCYRTGFRDFEDFSKT